MYTYIHIYVYVYIQLYTCVTYVYTYIRVIVFVCMHTTLPHVFRALFKALKAEYAQLEAELAEEAYPVAPQLSVYAYCIYVYIYVGRQLYIQFYG